MRNAKKAAAQTVSLTTVNGWRAFLTIRKAAYACKSTTSDHDGVHAVFRSALSNSENDAVESARGHDAYPTMSNLPKRWNDGVATAAKVADTYSKGSNLLYRLPKRANDACDALHPLKKPLAQKCHPTPIIAKHCASFSTALADTVAVVNDIYRRRVDRT